MVSKLLQDSVTISSEPFRCRVYSSKDGNGSRARIESGPAQTHATYLGYSTIPTHSV
jgi:hypothetical protein